MSDCFNTVLITVSVEDEEAIVFGTGATIPEALTDLKAAIAKGRRLLAEEPKLSGWIRHRLKLLEASLGSGI